MQDTTVQLRFCRCKCEGKAKFLRLKTCVNQGSLAGTHVGKWTAVVKIVKIFQTKYPWSIVNWQLNRTYRRRKRASLNLWHEMSRLERRTNCLGTYPYGLCLICLPCVATATLSKQWLWELSTDAAWLRKYIKLLSWLVIGVTPGTGRL